jgi:SAM-dependent methyltransferase
VVRLNVGCGLDVRDGWVNIDTNWNREDSDMLIADARDLTAWHGQCETVLLNHVLHLFDYTEAEKVLDECVACLAPGGELVIVDADIMGAIYWAHECPGCDDHVADLVADEVEPTFEGKVLRWATWHGTRRSMWSLDSLADRLERRGLAVMPSAADKEWAGAREWESFVVVGRR